MMGEFLEDVMRAERLGEQLHELLGRLVQESHDYEIERLLKRSEAELMDLRHNLSLVRRLLAESQ